MSIFRKGGKIEWTVTLALTLLRNLVDADNLVIDYSKSVGPVQ